MVRRPLIGASDPGIEGIDRSRPGVKRSAATLLAIVLALATSSCTRPEDAASAEVSLAPVSETFDGGDSGDPEDDDESTDDASTSATTSSATMSTSTTTNSTTIADGASTSTTIDTGPTTSTTTTSTTPRATTTITPDDASDLTLIFDGILPFRFGDRDVAVVPVLTDLLGAPALDELREYPAAEQGVFLDAAGEESFVTRFGRTVCYANGLCVQFGAGAPETLIFTGWRVGDPSSGLTTRDGLTIGSTLDDFEDLITFDPALGCLQVVDGSAAGIDVTLLSADGDFATTTPAPAAISVVEMRAGQLPAPTAGDC